MAENDIAMFSAGDCGFKSPKYESMLEAVSVPRFWSALRDYCYRKLGSL